MSIKEFDRRIWTILVVGWVILGIAVLIGS